ncbi:amidase family protein [Nocardioides ochotonae]|uniref:amidase family protein n=1 Tax=Nocardioides ochotonae TaxID=2685869 RepID=UPI00140BA6D4
MKKQTRARTSLAAAAVIGASVLAGGALGAPAQAAPTIDPAPAGAVYLAPYWTEADLTGDRQVTREDVDLLVAALGTADGDAGWAAVAVGDLDADGVVELSDVADLAQRMVYDDGAFELVEASALDMQAAMNAGVTTSVEITRAYLARIAAYDAKETDPAAPGRALNSIIATNKAALEAAAASDAARAANGGPRSMLDGLPVLLKDNYDTHDMATTAGCSCWEDNLTEDDAFMVKGLREAGAVLLGKASLDEFAYGFASEFSAGQPVGSSKLVASPYNLARTAGGSSGGTGASIAANLGAIGFGTDTGGSIRVPSSYNQLVGVRPTVGLASRDGIVPLALSQDTGGPMARTVSDAAIALDAVVGIDPADPVTATQAGKVPESYTAGLDADALAGKRLGYLASMVPTNAAAKRLFTQAVADLEAQGAVVEEITIDGIGPVLSEGSGSTNEFKHDLADYVANHLSDDVTIRTLDDIIASGRFVPSRRSTFVSRNAVTEEQYDAWMERHTEVLDNGGTLVTGALDAEDLDALIYPSGTPYGTHSTNMRLSPNTGLPAVTVPMGQAIEPDASITGAGVNLELLGRDFSEGELLAMAYAYEQATQHRVAPALYGPLEDAAPAEPVTTSVGEPGWRVTTSTDEIAVGETVTVTVTADAASDLYAYDLALDFDPEVLAYVEGSAGTDNTGATYAAADDGTLHVVHTELGGSPASEGTVVLAQASFTAVGAGATEVLASAVEQVSTELAETSATDLGSADLAVEGAAPVATTDPRIAGKPAVGKLLTATPGAWDVAGARFSYEWLRAGTPIPGATARSYRVRPADAGRRLAVRVTASRAGHAAGTAVSHRTAKVAAARTRLTVAAPAKVGPSARPVLRVQLSASGAKPTGTLRVTYGGKVVAKALPVKAGRATLRLPSKRPGTRVVRVVLTPDQGFTRARGTATVTVRR